MICKGHGVRNGRVPVRTRSAGLQAQHAGTTWQPLSLPRSILNPWYSKCGPRTSSLASHGLLGMQNLRHQTDLLNQTLYFNEVAGDLQAVRV